jgi:hemolysin activation/secretion protein
MYHNLRQAAIFGSSMATCACFALSTMAQSTPPGVTIPPTTPDAVEQTIFKPSQSPLPLPLQTPASLPPLQPQTPSNQEPPEVTPPSRDSEALLRLRNMVEKHRAERFFIKKIEVQGNTILQDEITGLTQPYENRELTLEDLLELRSSISKLYIEKGYITSAAFLPLDEQDFNTGIIKIQVLEGDVERIEVGGLRRLRAGYVTSRLKKAISTPLNQQRLEEALQLLQLDPLIEQVKAELVASSTQGSSILRVNLKEAPAFHSAIAFENNQSPSIGSIQGSVAVSHDNALGFGDRLSATYGRTEGLNLYNLSYSIPVNALNGSFSVGYNNDDSSIIAADFRDVGISSEAQTYSFGFRQPLSRTPNSEFALSLGLDLRRSQTYILDDIPFSFTAGSEDGESKVTVIRFSQDWVNRGVRQVLAARSQFNLGINAFDATINDTGTDGQFFSWLGQFQWVQQLSSRNLLVARIDAQLTPDSLLSLERFSIGGVGTVRGYGQNQLVADNGILSSVEVRFPLTSDARTLQLVSFFEIGTVWNNREIDPDPTSLASFGLGLSWLIQSNLALRLDYGIPLISVGNRGNSLQENGFHFSLRYQPF